jgi:hypothetical protein
MLNAKNILLVTVISLVALAGCNSSEQSATQTSPSSSPASQTTGTSSAKTGFSGLLSVVSKTKTAVKAGNFAKAKTEFGKFEDSWKPVEDGVKAKSPAAYKAIEESMDKINGELKASKPSKEKVSAALQSLDKSIAGVAKP